jgi:protease IV
MSQHPGSYPPLPPSIPAPPGAYGGPGHGGSSFGPQGPPSPRPQVVHIVAKPGGWWRATTIVIGLLVFAVVFISGLLFGILGMVRLSEVDGAVVRTTYREGGSNQIAIIPVLGGIDDRQAEFVRAAVKNVLEDSSIRAVVLRVDSPGGGVSESDQIWHQVEQLKAAGLPVVASYGGVAASGGYYVSCGSDYIMAEETCITGSIGVIAQVMTLEGLMQKVGIQPITIVASGSPQKNVANDMFRTWDDNDKSKIRTMLDAAYATFNQRVRAGRKAAISDPAKVDALANGSIYTAAQAKESGLIDGIGYLDDAIAKAEARTGLPAGASTVVMLRQPPTLFGDGLFAQSRQGGMRVDGEAVRGVVNDLAAPRVMYLLH